MSKAEILAEISKLEVEDRREILERLHELEELDLLHGAGSSAEEKVMLKRELEAYHRDPLAGSDWNDVEARLKLSKS